MSANASFEMRGASRWLEAAAPPTEPRGSAARRRRESAAGQGETCSRVLRWIGRLTTLARFDPGRSGRDTGYCAAGGSDESPESGDRDDSHAANHRSRSQDRIGWSRMEDRAAIRLGAPARRGDRRRAPAASGGTDRAGAAARPATPATSQADDGPLERAPAEAVVGADRRRQQADRRPERPGVGRARNRRERRQRPGPSGGWRTASASSRAIGETRTGPSGAEHRGDVGLERVEVGRQEVGRDAERPPDRQRLRVVARPLVARTAARSRRRRRRSSCRRASRGPTAPGPDRGRRSRRRRSIGGARSGGGSPPVPPSPSRRRSSGSSAASPCSRAPRVGPEVAVLVDARPRPADGRAGGAAPAARLRAAASPRG